MKDELNYGFKANTEAFSIATLIYTRLRRVSGRVIDAMYLVENEEYARHVVVYALSLQDDDVTRLAGRLQSVLDLELDSTASTQSLKVEQELKEDSFSNVTEDEIYRAQVSHHYIGALR